MTTKDFFNEILESEMITEFKNTPIQLIFSTRGIPGVDRYAETILKKNGFKNPRDVLMIFRDFKRVSNNYSEALGRLDNYLLSIGFVSPRRKVVCIAIYAIDPVSPKDLIYHWVPK